MFRRRRRDDETAEPLPDELDAGGDGDGSVVEDDLDAVAEPRPAATTSGPWDLLDAPDDDVPRLDLGAIRVPVPAGIELRVEVDQESQTVVAAVLNDGSSALQLGAFAAPRSSGIWPEVADEIVAGLRAAGGGADPVDGTFGRELAARIPMEGPNGQRVVQPARFIGVDGPRWFLRGLLQGPAATDPTQAARLEDVFRGVVVVRGTEAMAPRDPLPLRMPRDLADAAAAAGEAHGEQEPSGQPDLNPFERGPEITETR